MQSIILSELNVKGVETLDDAEGFVKYSLNPIPKFLGRKFGKDFPRVQKALRGGEPDAVRKYADALLAGKNLTVEIGDDTFEVTPEEVEVIRDVETDERYALAEEMGYLAALDTSLTPELVAEGFSNEVKRRIQVMRKDAGFEIEDRIEVVYVADERLTGAIEQFREEIMSEVLAKALRSESPANGFYSEIFEAEADAEPTSIKSESFTLGVKQV
jgi:isoleucyl-tRNA synthetase